MELTTANRRRRDAARRAAACLAVAGALAVPAEGADRTIRGQRLTVTFAFRSGDGVTLEALSWRFETDVFVDAQGGPLSDHDALAVRFAWTATAP